MVEEQDIDPAVSAAPEAPAPVEPAAPAAEASSTLNTDQLFSGTADSATPAAEAAPVVMRGRIDRFGIAMGTGRRKTAVARVRLKQGSGELSINGRTLEDYFPTERDRSNVVAPLRTTENLGRVDIWVRVEGGGPTGQAGAIMLGVARALQALDPSLHGSLADHGFLTRDGRMVERKKYGRKKARRSFQFSKR